MKILAFADSHGSMATIRFIQETVSSLDPDIIICAGDYTDFGRFGEPLLKAIRSTNRPFFYVTGNHENSESQRIRNDLFPTAIDLNGIVSPYDDVALYGLGGHDIFAASREWRVSSDLDVIRNDLSQSTAQKSVFVTHEPPTAWIWPDNPKGNAGNPLIDTFIEDVQPDLIICGHLHVSEIATTEHGKMRIVNPGAKGACLDI